MLRCTMICLYRPYQAGLLPYYVSHSELTLFFLKLLQAYKILNKTGDCELEAVKADLANACGCVALVLKSTNVICGSLLKSVMLSKTKLADEIPV